VRGKNIILGVTGSIAAYKTPALVRLLRKGGANVKVIMTDAAKDFVTPLTLSTVSNYPVLNRPFNPENGQWESHVDLALWADLMVIAPLSANTLAKMATGITDNLLLATFLSSRSKVMVAPAMDLDMYKHPSTQHNLEVLQLWNTIILEPTEGELASGLCGAGRMEEPELIAKKIYDFFIQKSPLTGKKVLISAGPTYEAIDPVRFVGNHSTGKMGFAIAQELINRGAEVFLVHGPVSIPKPKGCIQTHAVVSAQQMYDICTSMFVDMDMAIMTAAVADFAVENIQNQKIKKGNEEGINLKLIPNPDILAQLGVLKTQNQKLVGFALETQNEIENAILKLKKKNLDLIVLNSLQDEGSGFGTDTNLITLIDKNMHPQRLELQSKTNVAKDILDNLENQFR
jgi:phosphopantothenoylcysteine decarboxylase/phosphopantothenate--cysteine ligase